MARKATAKSFLTLLLSLQLVGCMDRTDVVSQEKFFSLNAGATVLQMKDECGPPMNTYVLENGDVEYEYVENLTFNDGLQIRNHYIFVTRNDIIIAKKTYQERTPSFDEPIEDPNLH